MSEVEVRIEYGKYSNEEADKFYCYLKRNIQSFVPHAKVTCVKESLDLGKTNSVELLISFIQYIGASNRFNVYVNNKEICLQVSERKMNVPEVSLTCCKFFPSSHTKSHSYTQAGQCTSKHNPCIWMTLTTLLFGAKLCRSAL